MPFDFTHTEQRARQYLVNRTSLFTVGAGVDMINRMTRCLDDVYDGGIGRRHIQLVRNRHHPDLVEVHWTAHVTYRQNRLYENAYLIARHSLGDGDDLTWCRYHQDAERLSDCWCVTINDAIRGIDCPLAPIKE